ncbi:MAG: tetratricopeptide repeat protein [Desulfarculaceae bacterium]|nr:tetratricopeptide repeat protein [Desulfarculaceae bacterium]
MRSSYYYYMRFRTHADREDYEKAEKTLKKAIEIDPDSKYLKKEMIRLYLTMDQSEMAVATAQELVGKRPHDTDALKILAKLKLTLDKQEEAENIYQKIIDLAPDDKDSYLTLGNLYMKAEKHAEAFTLYTTMAEKWPDSYVAHFYLGKIHLIRQNLNYAEKEFLKTVEIRPDLVEPRLQLINVYKARKNDELNTDEEITEQYNRILSLDKNNKKASMALALHLFEHGDRKRAEQIFIRLGEEASKNKRILMLAVDEYINGEQYKDASILFSHMLEGAPENPGLHFFAGWAYDSLKQFSKAIHHFSKVTPGSRYYKKSRLQTALLYSKTDRTQKAVTTLEKLHERMPEDIDIITYLGSFYKKLEEYDKSISILKKGISLSGDNADLLFSLAVARDNAGKKEECIESMKKVIELEPENADALNYLGYTYADLGIRLDKAEQLIKKALELKPDDGYITDSLGWVYYKKGLFSRATPVLEKAAKLTDYDPVITEHLADSLKHENKLDKALEMYRKALENAEESEQGKIKKKIRDLEQTHNAEETE